MTMTGDEEGEKMEVINLPSHCRFMTSVELVMTDDSYWR